MDYNQVNDLIKTIENSNFTEFELHLGSGYIRMSKNATTCLTPSPKTPTQRIDPAEAISETIEEPITILPDDKPEIAVGNLVTAPIVGTFYNSPSPGKPVFVKLGDTVKKGDILCIVEAMKVMNEIKSGFDGSVVEILAENEQMVEFAQPLFRIV